MINIKNKSLLLELGHRIKSLRIELSLSQEKLANIADIPISQIGRIERGEINSTISTIQLLATSLNTNLSSLLLNIDNF